MTKQQLKRLRVEFREAVFKRDGHRCVVCRKPAVDAHHIIDRHLLPCDGYVVENGISLCNHHHLMAEQFHTTDGVWWFKGFRPDDLYALIGSSHERARDAALALQLRLSI